MQQALACSTLITQKRNNAEACLAGRTSGVDGTNEICTMAGCKESLVKAGQAMRRRTRQKSRQIRQRDIASIVF